MFNRYLVDIMIENLDVEDYVRSMTNVLPLVKDIDVSTLSGIWKLVSESKANGFMYFLESSKYYVQTTKVIEKGKEVITQKPLFEKNSGFMIYFKAKTIITMFDYKSIDRDKLLTILRFFRLVSDKLDEVKEEMLENLFSKDLFDYEEIKETKDEESFYKTSNPLLDKVYPSTLSSSIKYFMINQGNIKYEVGRLFRNKYGNLLKAVKITFKRSKDELHFIIYIPAMEHGVYALAHNKFITKKSMDSYMHSIKGSELESTIALVFSPIIKLIKTYYINKDDSKVMRSLLQDAVVSLFYGKKTMHYSEDYYKSLRRKGSLEAINTYYENKLELEYKWNPFIMIASKTESLTDFEIDIEHRKFYAKEFVSSTEKSGADILKNFGKQGYEVHRRLPLNNKWLKYFDPAYINNKGDFLIAWDGIKNENNQRISLLDRLTPFAPYNLKSVRNALSAFILGHAFELQGIAPDYKLTESIVTKEQPPMYLEWFAFLDHVDSTGRSTNDGQRLINKRSRLAPYLYNLIKIAFPGADKGVSVFMNDELFFMHNGQEIHVNVFSPINVASRSNYGVLFEGLYNGKKYINGNKDQEVRDLFNKPLKEEELLEPQELFLRRDGIVESLGTHFVGLMSAYFVKDPDSAYKNDDELEDDDEDIVINSNRLGTEFFNRNSLMGFKELEEYFLGTEEERHEKELKVLSDEYINKKYSKRGYIIRNIHQTKALGFSSTVAANSLFNIDKARINLLAADLPSLLVTLKKVSKDIDVNKIRKLFFKGEEFFVTEGLQGRNPSMDDANQILVGISVLKADPKYTKYSFIEVNPMTWARAGGDFDGDQGSLSFLPKDLSNKAKGYYGTQLRNIKPNGFEYKIAEMYNLKLTDILAKHTSVKDLRSFIKYISMVKRDDTSAYDELFTNDGIKHIKRMDSIVSMSSNLITTRISKQLIGVAKGITMKALEYIENGMSQFKVDNQKLKDTLRSHADALNNELVQSVINIQKWNDDLEKVIETVLTVYRMSQIVSLTIESEFYPTKQTYNMIRFKMRDFGVLPQRNLSAREQEELNKDFLYNHCRHFMFSVIDNKKLIDIEYTRNGGEIKNFVYNVDNAEFYLRGFAPEEYFRRLIDVINPEGKIFKTVLDSVKEDMKGMDINSMFFTLKGREE